jgi:hypothetical protein
MTFAISFTLSYTNDIIAAHLTRLAKIITVVLKSIIVH